MNVIATIWDWYDFTLFFVAGERLSAFASHVAAISGCGRPR